MRTIMHGDRYELKSYGNGMAYCLAELGKSLDDALFVQGDEALDLMLDIERAEHTWPEAPVDDVLGRVLDWWR